MNGGSARWMTARVSPRIWGVLVVCGIGLILVAGFVVYPMSREARELRAETLRLRRMIAEQELLLPARGRVLVSNTEPLPAALRMPPRKELASDEVEGLPAVFAALAKESGVRLVSAAPLFGGGNWTGGRFIFTVAANGEFGKLRGFALRARAMPACDSLRKLEIRHTPEGEQMLLEFGLAVKQ